MKIMSFNLLCYGSGEHSFSKRIMPVTKTISKYMPDCLGVQEAHIDWIKALDENFSDYNYVGVGRDDGKEAGEFSAVFYKKDRFTLLDSGTFWLSETPEIPSKGWDSACIRICSWAMLKDKTDGNEFVHMNTHLDHIGKTAMLNGAQLVAQRANETANGLPVILTGDFNVTPDSAPCKAIKDSGFKDSRDAAAKTDYSVTYHAFESENAASAVIDYVFFKGNFIADSFSVIKDKVDGNLPSDHYPVLAELKF